MSIGLQTLSAQTYKQVTVPITGLQTAYNVAVDSAGNFYIASICGQSGCVMKVPAGGGTPVPVYTANLNNSTQAVGVDSAGNLFVTLTRAPYVVKVAASTGLVTTVGSNWVLPAGVVVDRQGNVYVSDAQGNDGYGGVWKIANDGSGPQTLIPIPGYVGTGVAVDLAGDLFLTANHGIYEVPVNGGPLTTISSSQAAFSLTVDPSGNLFGDSQGSTIQEYPAGGGTPVSLGSGLSEANGLASDSQGNIFVADYGNDRIVEFQKTSATSPPPQTVTSVISYVKQLTTARNNYSGLVGFAFTVGATPIQVSSLGRYVLNGNVGTHLLKLVQANGVDLPGGSTTLATNGATLYQFDYAPLASPVTLLANATYYMVSQETFGGDYWWDYSPMISSDAVTILGPSYTDSSNNYITVGGAYNYSYVPVSFLYSNLTSTASLSVAITSPASGGTVSNTIPVTVSTTGAVASLQVQVDGVNAGAAVPVSSSAGPGYTLSLNTTTLSDGLHSLTVVASDAQSKTATSPAISITVNNATMSATSFVTGESLGGLRTNYNGFVGFQMKIGSTPVVVTFLGRYVAPGDSRTHLLQLVSANGQPVAGGSVTISLSGATAGQFSYGALPAPVTLQANTSYFLVSQEAGDPYFSPANAAFGDPWYDLGPVTTTSVASVTAPVYTDGNGNYVPVSGSTGYSYVPVSFLYESSSSLNVNITSPQSGAQLSGSVPVTVITTGTVTSLQLQVDGVNQGAPVSAGPLTFNTTTIGNGQHTLTVVASNGTTASATSPGIPVVINNGGGVVTTTAFITGETPSTLRNNYSGFVGMSIDVGSNAITVSALGRLFAAGNTGTHILKLVQTNGTDVPGGSVTVAMTGGTAGQFVYGTLASPIALLANTTYYLMSQETAGGDNWYNFEPVTGTNAASIVGPVYTDGHGNYVFVPGFPNQCYVPLSFEYQ